MQAEGSPCSAAYGVLRSAALLQRFSPATLTPQHLSKVSEAAAALVSAYLGTGVAEDHSAPPRAARTPLSPMVPLSGYLSQLPTLGSHVELPVFSSATSPTSAKDGSTHQQVRDVERDTFLINGQLLQGSSVGFSGVLQACVEAASGAIKLEAASTTAPATHAGLSAAMAQCLRIANRTSSGGDAFEAALHFLGLPVPPSLASALPLVLTADSTCRAPPVELSISGGCWVRLPPAQHEGGEAASAAASGVQAARLLLEAHPHLAGNGGQAAALEEAVAWACQLRRGFRVNISAATHYAVVLQQEGQEPRAVARLKAVFQQILCVCLDREGGVKCFPSRPATVALSAF